jgi:DNA-binding MarR family transcriptional regulator
MTRAASTAAIRDRFLRLVPRMILLHERVARGVGLNDVELQVLHLLSLSETPLAPSELSSQTELPRSTMTRVLAKLEQRGFIARDEVPSDGRRSTIRVVPDAIAPVSAEFDRYAAAMDEAARLFTPAELDVVARYWEAFEGAEAAWAPPSAATRSVPLEQRPR